MTPVLWIALGYGLVAITLLLYTLALRRRLRRAQRERGRPSPTGAPVR